MNIIIKRDKYLRKLIAKKNNGLIKVITGIRRCGKSFLLFNLFYDYLINSGINKNQIITITLDDDINKEYRDPLKLSKYIREQITNDNMYYIFIDEVQYAISNKEIKGQNEVEIYNVLNGLMRLRNVDIYVTGSNSKMLTKDVLTAFRGRADEIEVYPLTFNEYYGFMGGDKIEAYEEYSLYGGLPGAILKQNDEDKSKELKKLFQEVYYKDIIERYDILYPNILDELTDELCSSIGSLTNANKIARTLKSVKNINISSTTIANYLNYLTESFIFQNAKRYDIKGKAYFEYPSKYYCIDVGLRNAKLNFRQQDESHIMENIIYNELIARGYNVDVGVIEIVEKIEGKQVSKSLEIDFIVNTRLNRYYIQSAVKMNTIKKEESEVRGLLKLKDGFKRIIISKSNQTPWRDDNGILHLNIYEFLLNENSLDL